jgi:hypothetical protein
VAAHIRAATSILHPSPAMEAQIVAGRVVPQRTSGGYDRPSRAVPDRCRRWRELRHPQTELHCHPTVSDSGCPEGCPNEGV